MSAILAPGRTRFLLITERRLGSLRSAELDWLRSRLLAFLEQQPALLVIECCDVENVGAAFAGVLAEGYARARETGTRILLDHLTEPCWRVLKRCGLDAQQSAQGELGRNG